MHYGPNVPFGGPLFGWLIPIVLIGLILLALYMIFRKSSDTRPASKDHPRETQSALEILNERYARGELNDEEYQRMKKNLIDQ